MRQNGYIIIEGNIGAGKSTFAHALVTVFKANGLKAQLLSEPDETNNPFLPLYYSDPKRWAYTMQTHLLSKRYEMTQYAQHGALSGYGWFVMDRSYFGDLYFANVQMKDGYFTKDEYESYVSLHKAMQANIHFPTAAIFLSASPLVCNRRIARRMEEKTGRACEEAISNDYLQSLGEEIERLKAFMRTQTHVIDLAWDREQEDADIYVSADEVVQELTRDNNSHTDFYSPWGACASGLFRNNND
jgi:deoxyadenosine/deoxycytidine kinase